MEFTTQNGNKNVKIEPSTFQNAVNLKKAVVKCLLDAGVLKDINTGSITDTANLLNKFSEILLTAETSTGFENTVFECLQTCIYDDKYKINKQLFDDIPEAREDYYEIVSKCVEVNLRPFFKSLVSELKTRFQALNLTTLEQK